MNLSVLLGLMLVPVITGPARAQGLEPAIAHMEICLDVAQAGNLASLDMLDYEPATSPTCAGTTMCGVVTDTAKDVSLFVKAEGGRETPLTEFSCDPAPVISFPGLVADDWRGWARAEMAAGRLWPDRVFAEATGVTEVEDMLALRQAFLEGCGANGVGYSVVLGLVNRVGPSFSFSIVPPEERAPC